MRRTKMVEKSPCWLLLVVPVNSGQTELRGIATEQWIADGWRKSFLNGEHEAFIRIWVEPAELNHCFGKSLYYSLTSTEAEKVNALEEAGIVKPK